MADPTFAVRMITIDCHDPAQLAAFRSAVTDRPIVAAGWAYARCYQSAAERRDALKAWLHRYNHHRPHSACANQPPFTRLINVSGQYI